MSKKYLSLLPALVLVYFVWHAFAGERNVPKFLALGVEVGELQQRLDGLQVENRDLEQKVVGLREETLDLRLLEVSGRRVLGLADEGELSVPLSRCASPFAPEPFEHEC